ncbi:glycosyltransferase [Halomonas sp. XH26]|uniref:glycosyltransferase n=1 Tax=Halomonas sp. XH26 TaxID=2557993 RepID=UPI0020A1DA4B|nr:glycosyltransferase [Halomonas sp. XH26]UTA78635.1 glycosyltransferase [Halomonas sp. XH26]
MAVSIIERAYKLYEEGDYENSLSLYKRAGDTIGKENVKLNVSICEKMVNFKVKKSLINHYFDNVYVVNLKENIKDKIVVSKHLKENNIKFEIYEAVNGYKGEAFKKWEEYSKRPLGEFVRYVSEKEKEVKRGSPYIESAGAIGYIYTYLEILKDAKYKGYSRFLIIEDDIILANGFEKKIEEFLRKVGSDWKILQLGASQYGWLGLDEEKILSQGYYLPRRIDGCNTCGSFAIAFDESVVDELIEAESAFEAPFDHLPMGEIYERYLGQCFVAYPNIVMPDVGESTIRGARCQIEHSKRVKWRLSDFDYPPQKPIVNLLVNNKKQLKYLDKFDKGFSQPFLLRIYYNSSDGVRPVHNISSLIDDDFLKFNDQKLSLPPADYNLSLDEVSAVSESELVNFIEYKVGLKKENNSSFFEIDDSLVEGKKIVHGRVSVVIPTYKRPGNLLSALKSVVEQDYSDVEIVVVNDNGVGSEFNKETKDIVDTVRSDSPDCNIIYIEHKDNRNGAAARNTGVLNSTGEYISFLDDDDIYLPGRISQSILKLKETSYKVGAVYCGFLGWNSPENDLGRYKEGDLTKDILLLDYKKHYLHTNTATYKREAVIALNGFDESYRRHQDLEFNIRFFESYQVESIKKALVRLNPEPSAVSNKVYNVEMINLKSKFLSQFDYIISQFGEEIEKEVYLKHWSEVDKYLEKKFDVKSIPFYYKDFFKRGSNED